MDESELEDNCNFGDDVVYLKDSKREPSLNTMIRLDLERGPPMSELSLNIPTEPKTHHSLTESPITLQFNVDEMMMPLSKNPPLNENPCHIDENVQDDKSRYSPEMVSNPMRCRRKRKLINEAIVKQNDPKNQRGPEVRQCLLNKQVGNSTSSTVSATKETAPGIPITKSETCTTTGNTNISQENNMTASHLISTLIPYRITTEDTKPKNTYITLETVTLTCILTEDNQILPATDPKKIYPPQKQIIPSLVNLSLAAWSMQNYSKKDKNETLNIISLPSSTCDGANDNFQRINEPLPSTSGLRELDVTCDFDPYDGDFSPDDSDSDYRPDNAILNTSHTSCESLNVKESTPVQNRKRAKRGKAIKENWISESNKLKRMRGDSYCGRRKKSDGKVVFDVEKQKRCVKSRCQHNQACKLFECHKLTDQMRIRIFNKYWQQSWEGKKIWVQQTVQKRNVVTRKCSGNQRRENTFKYSFNIQGTKIQVCKKMYLNTLNIGEWSVHNWTRNIDMTEDLSTGKKNLRNENMRALEQFGRDYCKEFLIKMPKLESHYCRKTTSKYYLEPIWRSKRELYREYIQQLTETGKLKFKVSMNIFSDEFEAMNLSIFSPKKDQCDLCCSYKVGNVSEEIYNRHRSKKQTARDEKTKDKENRQESLKVFTFDLQAVLLSPTLKASALYYKTKLKVHNFTIFDIQTSDAYCFIWNEAEGGVSADEFASIMHFFLTNYVGPNIKEVILWSDGCTNQNRNAILANSLLQVAVQKDMTITHKYLEKGHTQMECDSMHSSIERKLRNREIYSPAQYVEACKTARLQKPYNVMCLQYDFFRRYSSMPYLSSIRPGKNPGEATVFDLRCIQYGSDGKILVKKEFNESFEALPRRIKKPGLDDSMPSLHQSRLPIQRSKYIHLQELKEVLPHDVHAFYDDLPHQCPDIRRNVNICSCRKQVTRANQGNIG